MNKFREHIGQGVAEKNTRRAEASNHWDSVIGGAPKKAQTSRAPKNRLTIMRGGYFRVISMQVRLLPPCQNNGRDVAEFGNARIGKSVIAIHQDAPDNKKSCSDDRGVGYLQVRLLPSRSINTLATAGFFSHGAGAVCTAVPVKLSIIAGREEGIGRILYVSNQHQQINRNSSMCIERSMIQCGKKLFQYFMQSVNSNVKAFVRCASALNSNFQHSSIIIIRVARLFPAGGFNETGEAR